MLRVFSAFVVCFVVLGVSASQAMAAAQALSLSMTVKTRTEADAQKPVEETAAVTATLQEDGLILREGDQETIYVIDKKRILRVDHAKKIVVDESLYAVPAFRSSEMHNRLGMEALVTKTKGAGHQYRFLYPAELEHSYALLATPDGDAGVSLTVRKSGAGLMFDGEELGSFEHGNWQMPAALADSYRFFAIYAYPMHPRLRKAMLSAPRGFGRLTLRHRPMDKKLEYTHITVTDTDAVQPRPLAAPEGYRVIYIDSTKLQPPVSIVRTGKDMRSGDDYTAQIDAALARKRYTEAMLAAWEHMVQLGSFPDGAIDRIIKDAPEKDWSRSLVTLIANPPGEGEDVTEYTRSLQTIADHISAPNKYELNVHLADLYLRQGQAQRAFDMLTYALDQNPYLTGAYITLGDIFFRQYDMQAALACWETALAIAPDHYLVGKVIDYRDRLERDYPEFF